MASLPIRIVSLVALLVAPLTACGSGNSCEEDACDCRDDQRLEDGTCCVGWTEPSTQGCLARAWQRPAPGVAFGEPGAQRLALAVDGTGAGLAAWQVAIPGRARTAMFLAEETIEDGDASTWTLERPAESFAGSSLGPAIAVGSEDQALLTWTQQEVSDGTVYVSSRDAEGRWDHPSPNEPLSFPPHADEPRPIITAYGEALVVWNQFNDAGFGVAVATRPAEDPEGPLHRPDNASDVLSPPVNFSNAPQLDMAGNGDGVIVWYQSPHPASGSETELMVFASERCGVQGSFSRPDREQFLSAPGAPVRSDPVRNPVVSLSPRGEALVVWTQDDGEGNAPVYLATRKSRMEDCVGEWSLPSSLDDAFSSHLGIADDPQVVHAPDHRVFVVWSHETATGSVIALAERGPDGRWTIPGDRPLVLSSSDGDAIHPDIAIGTDGEAVVVWQERSLMGPWSVVARRLSPGQSDWAPLEALSSNDAGDAIEPQVAIGSAGRTIAGWIEGPPLQGRVRFATID